MSEGRGQALREGVRKHAVDRLGDDEGAAFLVRLQLVTADLLDALAELYGTEGVAELSSQLVVDAVDASAARSGALRRLDRQREIDPSWFLSEDMLGYVCYADRFAGDLAGVRDRLDYLEELGIRYLHVMPLLKPRAGENDGGYAVQDYDAVDPRLGTMSDLESLTQELHERDMALCVDLVLNHTAQEHAWAQRASAGDAAYRAFYRFFPDRSQPDAYEQTLPEVFPDMAPGSFTHLPASDEWVWTTFHEFQWDLNWANPRVFRAMLDVIFTLANHGVDVLRLDAAPFLWKRMGTNCQNQPEAHRILQALKALTRLAMPGVVLKAEAIVGPDLLVPYLGGHDQYRPECDLAYDNQLMVMVWSAIASRDTRLAVRALQRRRRAPAGTGWVTYVRCHDDIGWAVSDEDAWGSGLEPHQHRQFLASFYAGRFDGSFASGADFQSNPATGDVRTSGAAASLAGLDGAIATADDAGVTAALARLELAYAIIFSFGGIPLLYMGDELAMPNDTEWATDPAHADDNRWMHRPRMDWASAERRFVPGTVEARMFGVMRTLGLVRRSTAAFRSDATTTVLPVANPHVLAYARTHARAFPVLCLANFSDAEEQIDAEVVARAGVLEPIVLHASQDQVWCDDGSLRLSPWGYCWLTSGRADAHHARPDRR